MRKEDKGVIIGQLADTVKQYGHFYLVDTTAMDAAATSDLVKMFQGWYQADSCEEFFASQGFDELGCGLLTIV